MSRARVDEAPLAILAGGLARRLGALSAERPKALMTVAGRPFLDHQLALVRAWGVRRVVVCAGHLGGQIEDHLRRSPAAGLEVECVHDGPRLLGTAGALRAAAERLGPSFWVLYGDSYLDPAPTLSDLRGSLAAGGGEGLLTVCAAEAGRGNVLYDDGRVVAYDKVRGRADMRHVDWGLTLLTRAAIERVPLGAREDLGHLFALLAQRGLLAAHLVSQRFFEIGSPAGLAETRLRLEGR